MKLYFSLLFVIIAISSCSKKPKDFIGVHDFMIMGKTVVVDTTERQESFFRTTFLKIITYKLTPLKIDIFNEGDRLSGTCNFWIESEFSPSGKIKDRRHIKTDLKNIHIINDTLVADLKIIHSVEIKLSKSGEKYYLIMPNVGGQDGGAEKCNEFAKVENGKIYYESIANSREEAEKIKESNRCSTRHKMDEMFNSGYKKEKQKYLESILSKEVDPE